MVLVEDRPDAQVIAMHMLHPAGAAQDPPGRSGLAHLVEHARYHGSAAGYDTELAQLGGWGNAWVDHDLAATWARVPAEAGMALLDLERSRLQHWKAPQELAPLRRTLAAELEWREVDPLLRQFWPTGHPYARPVMGTELEAVRPEELQNFADNLYDPTLARLAIVGTLSPALRSFLDSLPTGGQTADVPGAARPTPPPLHQNQRRIWAVPPSEVALRPGLALLAEFHRLRQRDAYVWVGRQGGLFSVEGRNGGGSRAADWSQAIRSLQRQQEEEREDPVRRAQALNLCWEWGTDCTAGLLGGYSSSTWAGRLERALRRQDWPEAPAASEEHSPPTPPPDPRPGALPEGSGVQVIVESIPSRRGVVELSLACDRNCRTLPDSYLENLWERRSDAVRHNMGGSRVEMSCDARRCWIWVDSLSEELAPTLKNVYDWLQRNPVSVDLDAGNAQDATIAALVGRPPTPGGHISARQGGSELARLRAAPLVVVAVGAMEGLEAGLRPWLAAAPYSKNPNGNVARHKPPSGFPLAGGADAASVDESLVSLLWQAPSPTAPERSAWEVAFLSITGSAASALELRLREELGWVYGFALSEEHGANGSYMRLDLDVPVEQQEALYTEVADILARIRPAPWASHLWLARQQDPRVAQRVATMGRWASWGLPSSPPSAPNSAKVEQAFLSVPSPIWVSGGVLRP